MALKAVYEKRSYKLGIVKTMYFVCKRHCQEKENKIDQEKICAKTLSDKRLS